MNKINNAGISKISMIFKNLNLRLSKYLVFNNPD